ncbi:MAG TPA: hypothetical protein VM764_02855 [Gemmatimonadaceae bacterium]|nr:hypothetical protein [Gemmatimonadaceae bacterium]
MTAFPREKLAAAVAKRAPWIAAVIVLAAALATMTSDPIGVFYDDAIYLLTAKALAEGQGYVYAMLPGTPPAIHYPPLWPAILAVAWKVAPAFPANVAWLKLINPVILAFAAAFTVTISRRLFGLPWWLALGIAVLAFSSIPVLVLTNVLLSEPLFMMMILPTLYVAERFVREGGVRWALAAAAMAALIVLGRTVAGVVIIATVMVLLLDRRWRDVAVYCVVTALLLLPWQMLVWGAADAFPDELRGSYGPYLEWVMAGYREGGWPFLRDVIVSNTRDTWTMIGIFVSPLIRGTARAALAAAFLSAALSGVAILWFRRGLRLTALSVLGYLAVVLSWPFRVERFLWAIWPLLLVVAVVAAHEIVRELRSRSRPRLAMAAMLLASVLAFGHATYNVRGHSRGWTRSASRDRSDLALNLVRYVNADKRLEGRVIASEDAPMVALYTGLVVVPVDILTTREHLTPKSHAEAVDAIERIDRRFRPDAYVLLRGGPHFRALMDARLDSPRTLTDVSPPGLTTSVLLLDPR